jgi:putative transposase
VRFFHVVSRGNRHQPIFFTDADRLRFLRCIGLAARKHGWECHAYCLMTNHYHLLVAIAEEQLARAMLLVNGTYARYLNWRHTLDGHVFQGPYGAEPVDSDEHLMETCRYIVRNPVRAAVVRRPADWEWSSYRATGALAQVPSFLTVSLVRRLFGSPTAYREFCNQVAEQPGCRR